MILNDLEQRSKVLCRCKYRLKMFVFNSKNGMSKSEFERVQANRWTSEKERVQRSSGEREQVLETVSEF